MFSSEYITAVIGGQALGGVFTAAMEVLSLTFVTDKIFSALIFFLIGTLMLIVSMVLYLFVSQTLFFKFHVNQSHVKANSLSVNSDDLQSPVTATTIASVNRTYLQPDWKKICGKIWSYGFCVFLCFVTTLSVYPAITVLVKPIDAQTNHSKWNQIYFLPVLNYLLFNCGDYAGRIISGWLKWPSNKPKFVAFLTILRIAFVPGFLVCNITQNHPLPILIHSDEIFIVLMAFFSLTNGYIANISCIYAPT